MTIDEQIVASVGNGLTRHAIEALLGIQFTPQQLEIYRKAKAVHDLKEKKRRAAKKYERLSGYDRVQKHRDKYSSIDEQMDAALSRIDWERRNEAEKSLGAWVKTYMCEGLALNDEPSKYGYEVLWQMERALTGHRNYMICMGRGFGKSSYCICAALYALATGLQKYVMIISNNSHSSSSLLSDIWRVIEVPDSKFSQDYPTVCLPFNVARGSFRRRQLYHGRSTEIQKNAGSIVFATMEKSDGTPYPTSGSVITCRGITSGIRGAKHGTMRPSLVLLDDLQDFESAQNPAQVEKLVEIINKDIIPLAGKERLSILQTATPICPDDLVEKIKGDKSWTTTIYPAIMRYPTRMELWDEYFKLFQQEQVDGTSHAESLAYYRENFDKMNEGSDVFSPTRYSEKDGHISAIQKLLELRFQIGENAFMSEYQMSPVQVKFALPITPELVASRKSTLRELEVPSENVQFVCAASDLNVSKYITTVIMVFLRNHTSVVIWRKFKKCRIPANIPPEDYASRLYNLLAEHGRELKALGVPLQAWSIDGNGLAWNAVTSFCRNSMKICGIPACAFVGRASHQYRSFMRTRLKEDVNRTLLCGDEDEHKKAGTGKKYTFFDSDFYHEKVQQGFLQEVGNLGSISWYDGADNAKWAVQVCGEKLILKKQRSDQTTEYHWKENGPDHDALDAIGQCLATHASMGFATSETGFSSMQVHRRRPRKRIRIM